MFRYSVIIVSAIVVLIAAPQHSAAAMVETPDGVCIVNAYVPTSNGDHISQVGNGTIQFGTKLFIETDCPGGYTATLNDEIHIDVAAGGVFYQNVSSDTRSLHLEGEGWNVTFVHLQFWPDQMYSEMLVYYMDQPTPEGEFWTLSDMRSHEFFVAAATVVVSWLVSMMLVDRASRWVIERQSGKEITEGWN